MNAPGLELALAAGPVEALSEDELWSSTSSDDGFISALDAAELPKPTPSVSDFAALPDEAESGEVVERVSAAAERLIPLRGEAWVPLPAKVKGELTGG